MSYPTQPHPEALFSLRPVNERAYQAVIQPANKHLVSSLADGRLVLDLDHMPSAPGKSRVLAIPGSDFEATQCSFGWLHHQKGPIVR